MKRKITPEMLEAVKNTQVRIAAGYGAGLATLRKLGATEEELTVLGFVEAQNDETPN